MLYQVFSRNNDRNGNPYRLILIYSLIGEVVNSYEARSSMPNMINELDSDISRLPSIHLSPKEYNNLKKLFNPVSCY